jgi:hypothetical protein
VSAQGDKVEALDWVLAKLSAQARATPKAPSYKPIKVEPLKPVAPVASYKGVASPKVNKDLTLWKAWKDAPKHEKGERFDDLMGAMSGVVNKNLNKFRGAQVNRVQLEGKAYELAHKAFTRYAPSNPNGASPSTWLNWGLKSLKREAVKLQNTARVTEPMSQIFNKFETAKAELTDKLGYEPTLKQIAQHSGLPEKSVLKVHKEMRRDYEISGGGEEVEGAGNRRLDPYEQVAHIIYHDLKPHEQKVHELIYPRDGGMPMTKSGDIAKKLKWEVSKVSKAKNTIKKLLKERVVD